MEGKGGRLRAGDTMAAIEQSQEVEAAIEVIEATTPSDFVAFRRLYLDYAATVGLTELQRDSEVSCLSSEFSSPKGRWFLAESGGEVVGCVGVRLLPGGEAELRRLYVRPQARGGRIGCELARAGVEAARELGFERLVLAEADTASAGFIRRVVMDSCPGISVLTQA
jgi:predicted N-acetyltransferase YhbS